MKSLGICFFGSHLSFCKLQDNTSAAAEQRVKGAQSWHVQIEKFGLKFLNSSFAIRVNLLHP